jgi:hypothetical protein
MNNVKEVNPYNLPTWLFDELLALQSRMISSFVFKSKLFT